MGSNVVGVRSKLGSDCFSGPKVLSLALLQRVRLQLHVQSGRQGSVARVLGVLRRAWVRSKVHYRAVLYGDQRK